MLGQGPTLTKKDIFCKQKCTKKFHHHLFTLLSIFQRLYNKINFYYYFMRGDKVRKPDALFALIGAWKPKPKLTFSLENQVFTWKKKSHITTVRLYQVSKHYYIHLFLCLVKLLFCSSVLFYDYTNTLARLIFKTKWVNLFECFSFSLFF